MELVRKVVGEIFPIRSGELGNTPGGKFFLEMTSAKGADWSSVKRKP
jgi:hypothetical protein